MNFLNIPIQQSLTSANQVSSNSPGGSQSGLGNKESSIYTTLIVCGILFIVLQFAALIIILVGSNVPKAPVYIYDELIEVGLLGIAYLTYVNWKERAALLAG